MDGRSPSRAGSAAAHVFGITEMLEKIIMQLPARNILTCQRVCRHFRDTVQGSICIRNLLLLEPPTGSSNLKTTPRRLPSCNQQLSCTDHIHANLALFNGRRLPTPLKSIFISYDTPSEEHFVELAIDHRKPQVLKHESWRQMFGSNVPLRVKVGYDEIQGCYFQIYESMRLGEAADRFLADAAAGKTRFRWMGVGQSRIARRSRHSSMKS